MIQAIGVIIGAYGIWLRFSNNANRAIPYCLGIGIVLLCVGSALAHDHSRPELNEWFDKLQSGKGLCCSLSDGETVADPDWRTAHGHYQVRLDNEWIDVPEDAVIT